QSHEVHDAGAGRADRGEVAQRRALGAGEGVELAVDGDADEEHDDHDGEERRGAGAAAEVEVAGAGNEIGEDDGDDGAGLHCAVKTSFPIEAKCGRSLSKVTSSSSGTRRVREVAVLKFGTPAQAG